MFESKRTNIVLSYHLDVCLGYGMNEETPIIEERMDSFFFSFFLLKGSI